MQHQPLVVGTHHTVQPLLVCASKPHADIPPVPSDTPYTFGLEGVWQEGVVLRADRPLSPQ